MASESRFDRRILGKLIDDLFKATTKAKRARRAFVSSSGITYVVLVCDKARERTERRQELVVLCFVARSIFQEQPVVVGIATEHPDPSRYSFDAAYLRIDKWSEELQAEADLAKREFGFFRNAKYTRTQFEEYPMLDEEEK